MSHLNFNIRTARAPVERKAFNPRAKVSLPLDMSSALWTVFAVMAVAGATFAIVWFA
ncbi:MAG TPA: hypothetical protein VKR31_04780 [Rhizomicrobium sp.]|nr:hypothetical protein [Rhizomicrobium sp.]